MKISISLILSFFFFAYGYCIDKDSLAAAIDQKHPGQFKLNSFEGDISGMPVNYAIYLPKGYTNNEENYPYLSL